MGNYEHSVFLDTAKCKGCTTCLHHCPTEAIRIKNGLASINQNRCIDCGECIRVCPHHAKKAKTSKLSSMDRFKWKIALPAPTLYGQFDNLEDVDYVLDGLKRIGFDDVFEVSKAAELVSAYTRQYVNLPEIKTPVLSSACPVVIRLIALRYPSLEDHILHMLPPMEVAAHMAREKAKKEHPEFDPSEIGVCFISPCPAKASYAKNIFGSHKSEVDEVVSISDIYFLLIDAMKKTNTIQVSSDSGMIGIGWASTGGEATAILNDDYLAADGIVNVVNVLEQFENGNIPPVRFIELNACPGGCVGGVLSIQNPFIAKARIQSIRRYMPVSSNFLTPEEEQYIPEYFLFDDLPVYSNVGRLGNTMAESMRMMADARRIRDELPGIDCGACGAPNCRTLAEDAVREGKKNVFCPIIEAKKLQKTKEGEA